MDHGLRHRLLSLLDADRALRAELAASGALFRGYHPAMRSLHEANARELEIIIDDEGWPTADEVGQDGAEAALTVALHAISRPSFLRRCLTLAQTAIAQGDAPAHHGALLEDRIRVLEGREQAYGTQLDWDETGRLAPFPIAEPEGVDARRAAVGLPPLSAAVTAARARARLDGETPPADWAARRAEMEDFARTTGWR